MVVFEDSGKIWIMEDMRKFLLLGSSYICDIEEFHYQNSSISKGLGILDIKTSVNGRKFPKYRMLSCREKYFFNFLARSLPLNHTAPYYVLGFRKSHLLSKLSVIYFLNFFYDYQIAVAQNVHAIVKCKFYLFLS